MKIQNFAKVLNIGISPVFAYWKWRFYTYGEAGQKPDLIHLFVEVLGLHHRYHVKNHGQHSGGLHQDRSTAVQKPI